MKDCLGELKGHRSYRIGQKESCGLNSLIFMFYCKK